MNVSSALRAGRRGLITICLLTITTSVFAGHRDDNGYGQLSFRVPVNLYGAGELNIKRWLEKYGRIDTDHYYLTGVVVHSANHHYGYGGHALLRVGSNYAPRVDLRPGNNYITAPRYDDGKWRLYVREGAQVHAVTLLVQPRYGYQPGYGRQYNPGYHPGYNPGHRPGYNPGYTPGHGPGYNPGHHPGYSPGYRGGSHRDHDRSDHRRHDRHWNDSHGSNWNRGDHDGMRDQGRDDHNGQWSRRQDSDGHHRRDRRNHYDRENHH
jgi:hypothetical protein